MTIYWIIVAILLITAVLIVAIPLWRGRAHSNAVHRDNANLEVFRDQVAEMDADLRNGLLTQEMYDQGKQELQGRLLNEVKQIQSASVDTVSHPYRILAGILIILIPVVAISIYTKVGNPHAVEMRGEAVSSGEHPVMSEAALSALEAEADSKPDDGETVYKLAQAYIHLERYDQAAFALERLTSQYPNESQLWADYADVLAMASGRSLSGKPTELINKALKLDPENYKALALAGTAAMERKDYAAAVSFWRRLLKLIPPENQNHMIIAQGIQKAQEMLAQSGGKPVTASGRSGAVSGNKAISGTVNLSAKLKAQVSPEDTVFVLARAAEGPRMPLAIMRKQVKDLPVKFSLDDSMAMSPQMKLSNYDQIVIVARVSKSGNAMTQSGDLQGASGTVKPGTKGLNVVIDQIVQ